MDYKKRRGSLKAGICESSNPSFLSSQPHLSLSSPAPIAGDRGYWALNGPVSASELPTTRHSIRSLEVSSLYFSNRTRRRLKKTKEEKITLEVNKSLEPERNLLQMPRQTQGQREARDGGQRVLPRQAQKKKRSTRGSQGTRSSKSLIDVRDQHQQLLITKEGSPLFRCNYF